MSQATAGASSRQHPPVAVGQPAGLTLTLWLRLRGVGLGAAPRGDEGHHIPEPPGSVARIMDWDDMGMRQAGSDLDVAFKPLGSGKSPPQ
jgi:hypothetical protein